MRIGCLQFAPQVGDVDNNISRADAVLSRADPENLDLLVLPELAFTGYNFKSLQEISPFLEPQGSGITALWAQTLALKLNCVVTIGYPEKEDIEEKWPTSPEYYNSVIVVNPDGETIANYRKTFLYYTDETWALEGPQGFYGGSIPQLGTTAMGICMDINPYKFEAPWHAFEFAFHCLEVEANLVIVTMAWMTREDASLYSSVPKEPDMDTLTYWMARLEPLIRAENQEEIIVIFCNRAGMERDTVYAGTSTVVGIKDGEVNVYGLLGRGEEELLIVDTMSPPIAKLVYAPGDQGPTAVPIPESPSGAEETGQRGYEPAASERSSSTHPASNNSFNGASQRSAAQNQASLEGSGSFDRPRSLVSQDSHSICHSNSNEESHSSHKPCSSQNLKFGRRSSQPNIACQKHHHIGPLVLTRAQSNGNFMSIQDSISSRRPPQVLGYQSASPLQSHWFLTGIDSVVTSARLSPTSQGMCPKLGFPKTGDESPVMDHGSSGHALSRARRHNKRINTAHVPSQGGNFAFLPATSNVLLNIPKDLLPRADSPTLSMEMLGISQA